MKTVAGILLMLLRLVGYAALAILLFACLMPVYSMLIIFPITFLFGTDDLLYRFELAGTYGASAVTSLWLVSRVWSWSRKETLRRTKQNLSAAEGAG